MKGIVEALNKGSFKDAPINLKIEGRYLMTLKAGLGKVFEHYLSFVSKREKTASSFINSLKLRKYKELFLEERQKLKRERERESRESEEVDEVSHFIQILTHSKSISEESPEEVEISNLSVKELM